MCYVYTYTELFKQCQGVAQRFFVSHFMQSVLLLPFCVWVSVVKLVLQATAQIKFTWLKINQACLTT